MKKLFTLVLFSLLACKAADRPPDPVPSTTSNSCGDTESTRSLSVAEKGLTEGILLFDETNNLLYHVAGRKIFRTVGDGHWEKVYELTGHEGQSISSAILDEPGEKIYFWTSDSSLSTDIVELDLSGKTANSLLLGSDFARCDPPILDKNAGILYAVCLSGDYTNMGFYRKKPDEGWEEILPASGFTQGSAVAYSIGDDSYVCLEYSNGIVCRKNDEDWEQIGEASQATSLLYDPVHDRLFVAMGHLMATAGEDAAFSCSFLVREGNGEFQEETSLSAGCVRSAVVDESSGDLFFLFNTVTNLPATSIYPAIFSCNLYRYADGSAHLIDTTVDFSCYESLAINFRSGILYSFTYEQDFESDFCLPGGICPAFITDTIATCVRP